MAKRSKALLGYAQLSDEVRELAEGETYATGDSDQARQFNKALDEYFETADIKDPVERMKKTLYKRQQLYIMAINCIHGGRDPKEVPLNDMLFAMRHVNVLRDPSPDLQGKYRARVAGPLTGIRAICMSCQGGKRSWVAECDAVNCPLWPFRFGNNPFYGRIVDAEVEAEAEELEVEELVPLVERNAGGDNGSQAA